METKRGVLFVFATGLFLAILLSLVLAVQPERNVTDLNNSVKEAKNMTYGQCVSQNVAVKNDCYNLVKNTLSSCKNSTSDRQICSNNYKNEKTQCKVEFKSAKNECKKIKHNFFETTRYAFA